MPGRFNLNDYVTVQDRIDQFWEKYPDGRIETIMISDPNIFERVVIRAEVYKHRDNPRPDTSDIAAEEAGKNGMANTTSWHENCATSAIGRALADLSFSTSKNRASRSEMEKVQRMEADRTTGEVRQSTPTPITPKPAPNVPPPFAVNNAYSGPPIELSESAKQDLLDAIGAAKDTNDWKRIIADANAPTREPGVREALWLVIMTAAPDSATLLRLKNAAALTNAVTQRVFTAANYRSRDVA